MKIYKVTIDVLVAAPSVGDAVESVQEELNYLCALDNALAAWDYTPDLGVVIEQNLGEGDD